MIFKGGVESVGGCLLVDFVEITGLGDLSSSYPH